MLTEITYYKIFDKPLIMYLGIFTLFSFLFTATIAISNKKGIKFLPFTWHPRMAKFSIILAIIHGILGIMAYFN